MTRAMKLYVIACLVVALLAVFEVGKASAMYDPASYAVNPATLPAAHITDGDAMLGVLVARRLYPGNPCNGHEQVTTSRRVFLRLRRAISTPELRTAPMDNLLGLADLQDHGCLVWVNPGQARWRMCLTVLHEELHWQGYQDNETGQPIMDTERTVTYGQLAAVAPACGTPGAGRMSDDEG